MTTKRLHRSLCNRFTLYARWWEWRFHRHAHVLMAAGFLVISVILVASSMKPASALSAVPLAGYATVQDTGGDDIYFGASYGSNVTIDPYTWQLSGYAWSDDLGWIDFGNDANNPAGPVEANSSGALSGEAKVLNTGDYIYFNSSSYGSNVTVSGGVFSGYAWSDDIGWINFANVTASGYSQDLLSPVNPTVLGYSASGGSALTSGSWYSYPAPYFSWPAATDADSIPSSDIAGYYVYFGTNSSATPTSFQTGLNFTSPALGSTTGTYYFRMEVEDVNGTLSSPATMFTYDYDNSVPTAPTYVSVNPSGYSRTNNFVFSWPTSGPDAAADSGGSGITGFYYQINGTGSWQSVSGGGSASSVTLTSAASSGVNTFDLRTINGAGTVSLPVQTDFYFNNSAPTAPTNLTATPTSSTTNSFAFSWGVPDTEQGGIEGYFYSINALPTLSNASFTTDTSLASGPYATQQGANTFYIVAEDNAGNYDFSSCQSISGNPAVDGCAKVTFTATTTAPGVPGDVQAYDISQRDTQNYADAVTWTAPATEGSGFAGYDVYRSTDGVNFTKIGSTSGLIYADGGLNSQKYYYYVVAKDNAANYSAPSSTVTVTPTGRYTTPPNLVAGPTVTVYPSSINVTWATDRASSSFVEIKNGNTFVSDQGQTDQTTSHNVTVVGLKSQSTYTYTILSTDADGNTLTGSPEEFTTVNAPSIYDLTVTNITQSSAIVNFKSTAIANFALDWGETANYGQTESEDSTSATTNHSLSLTGLQPGQMYYFKVDGEDQTGDELISENSFTTLPLPQISNLSAQVVSATATTTLTVSWQTNIPTDSTITYSAPGIKSLEQSSTDMTTVHVMTLSNLADKSKYTITVSGRDQFGNITEAALPSYITPKDTIPPKISSVATEASSVDNSNNQIQVAVSWVTNEPATSQIEYDIGFGGNDYTHKTSLDNSFATHHLVIVSGLKAGTPYHLKILSSDNTGNQGTSGDYTVITGQASGSALQIIVNSLQNAFSWYTK